MASITWVYRQVKAKPKPDDTGVLDQIQEMQTRLDQLRAACKERDQTLQDYGVALAYAEDAYEALREIDRKAGGAEAYFTDLTSESRESLAAFVRHFDNS